MDSKKQMIGAWIITNRIGQGSFGDVFIGEHEVTHALAAIKVIDTNKWEDKSKVRRAKLLKREIRFSRLLHHPNIIKMIDTMLDNSKVILVLEHIKGGDLEMYIDNQKNRMISEGKCRDLFRQISGVDYLHKNSIIHRDIKPANIMLDETFITPKLIDFGFTTSYDQDKAMYSFLGSPHYAAPELLKGVKYDGPKVDIWSLGVTLYAMVTGTLPFQAPAMDALLSLIVNAKFSIPSYVPEGVADLIRKMLVVNVSERITMENVRTHYWIMTGYDSAPLDLSIPRNTPIKQIDQEVFAALKEFELKDDNINYKALADPLPNKIKNVYCLLLEARNRTDCDHVKDDNAKSTSTNDQIISSKTKSKKDEKDSAITDAPQEKNKPTKQQRRFSIQSDKIISEKNNEKSLNFPGFVKQIFSSFSKKKNHH